MSKFGFEADDFNPDEWKSREPKDKIKKVHRTGRIAQINLKATPEMIETFHQLAAKNGWSLAEAFEQVIMRFERSGSGTI